MRPQQVQEELFGYQPIEQYKVCLHFTCQEVTCTRNDDKPEQIEHDKTHARWITHNFSTWEKAMDFLGANMKLADAIGLKDVEENFQTHQAYRDIEDERNHHPDRPMTVARENIFRDLFEYLLDEGEEEE